jgi:uncharacterized protein YciI
MKNKFRIVAFSIPCVLLLSCVSFAQQIEVPHPKLVQFHLAILRKGPKWATSAEADRGKIMREHLANVLSMYESGKMAVAGPFGDETDLAGIFIVRTASANEAKTWVDADPAVAAGLLVPEIHPWWSEDNFKKPNSPFKLDTVYFVFLKKGANRKEGDDQDPEIQKLQKAHIANIERLAELKKLVVAGPFGDSGDLRGIFVFRVSTLKEAQDLYASDPMIKINRLAAELHPWRVPAGVLP